MPQKQTSGFRLKRNHSNALPRYIVCFDTETFPTPTDTNGRRFSHKFRLGVAISCRIVGTEATAIKIHKLTCPADLWRVVYDLSASNYTVWVVSHNALFDLVVCNVASEFEQSRIVVDWPRHKRTRNSNDDSDTHCSTLCILESPPTILAVKCVETQGRIVFVDTLNWFPVSLSELGKECGLHKLAMPSWKAELQSWEVYCQRDCEIVLQSFVKLLQWVKENDFGLFRYTGPSQAMSAFRHRFMRHQIDCHDNSEVKRLERRSYFGGRTEVFRMGDITETVHQYDVNALFPSVMSNGSFPCRLEYFELSDKWTSELPNIDFSAMVAEVQLDCRQPIYPKRMEGLIVYPTGRFKTVLCGRELHQAKQQGEITAIRSWSLYKLVPIFADWIAGLWRMRQTYQAAGNGLYDQFTKRLMNGLYGKFGQRSPKWINVEDDISALPWHRWTERDTTTGTTTQFRSVGWQIQKQTEQEEIDGTFVAISSFVTSAARCRMNLLRKIAGHNNLWYQGTDSLIVNDAGKQRLEAVEAIDQHKLGRLKLQASTNYGEILGGADYRLGEKVVISGRARLCETLADGTIIQRKFAAANALFQYGSNDTITETLEPWKRLGEYKKGVIQSDGTVTPVDLNEESDPF